MTFHQVTKSNSSPFQCVAVLYYTLSIFKRENCKISLKVQRGKQCGEVKRYLGPENKMLFFQRHSECIWENARYHCTLKI